LLSPRTISNDTAKNKREDNYLKSPTLPKDIKGAEVAVTSRPLEGSKKDEDKKEEKAWYEGFFEGLAQMGRDMTNTINKAADYVGDLIGDAVGAIGSLITGDYTPNVSKEFEEAARRTSANIGIPYEYLMAVMGFETGGTFSPSERNMAGSGATGLIQFMPSTARDMFGISTDQMASMSQIEQLAYVEKYYKNVLNGRQASTLTDAYMVVLYPAAVGKGDDYTLFRSGTTAYRQNAGLDVNKDGTVTAGEATEKVKQYLPRSGDSRDASKNGPSKSYSPMSVNKGSFLDDSPKGSYDYTLSRNGKTNVEIPAPFSGVVISALPESKSGGYGEDLLIYDPSTNLTHRLAHNQRLLVKEGDTFVKGQPIAIQGSTGRSRGTHIHHEVHKGKINYAQSVGARPQMIRDRSQSRPIVEGIINEWTAGSKGGETSSAKSVNDKPKSSVRKGWITPKSTSGSDWVNSSPTSQNNIPRKIAIAAGHWNTYGQGAPGEQAWNKLVAQQIANTGKERGFEVDYIEPSKTKKMSLAEVGAALAAKESQGYYAVEIHADRNDSAGRSGVIPGSKVDAADIALAKVFGSFSKGQYSGYALPRQGVSLLETVGMAEVNKMTPEEQAKFAKEIAAMFFDALGGAEPSDTPFDPNQLYSDDVDVYKYQRPQPQRRKVTSWAERERKAQERIKSGQVKRESYQTNPSRLRNNGVRPGGRPAEPNPQAKADLDIKEIVGSNSGSKELAIVASAGGDLSGLIPQVTALAPEPQVKKQTPAKVELPREIRSREVATVAETKGSVGYGGGSGGSSGAGGQSSTVSGVVYTQGDLGSPGAFHFDIKRVEGGFYEREYLDNYVQVNGKPIGSGITVKGGEYGAPRKYGGHGGWDYAFGDKNAGLTLVNGARLISVTPTKTYGDKLIFQLPTGEQFAIIHGRATQLGRESAGAEGAYAANVPSDSGGGGQMMMRRQPPRRKVTSWAERERRALERIQSGQVVRQSYRTNSSRIAKNNQQSKEDDKGLFGFIQIPNLFKRNTTLPSKPTKDDNQSFTPPVGKKLDIKSQVSQKDIVKAIPTNSKDLDVDEILDIKVSQASDAAMSKAEVVGNVIAEAAAKAHKQKKESTPEKAVKHITNVQRPAETAQNVSSYTRSITSNITRATKTQPVYQPDNDQNVILVSSQIDQTMVNVNVANSGMRSPCSGQMAGKKQRVQGPCVA
jgi:hypothetical protein